MAGILVGGISVAALVSDGGAEDDTVTIEAASGERGAPGNGIVFYSGLNEAGVAEADQYSDWEYVANNMPLGITYSEWVAGNCQPDASSTHPADRNLHVLVGYSLGRLGPIYFLHDRSRWNEVDTIWLLDPGSEDEMTDGGCDSRLENERRPGQYLAEWLAGGSNRRLIVIAADSTLDDVYDGLDQYYLNDIHQAAPDIASRAFLCIDLSTGHDDVPGLYMPLIAGGINCPAQARAAGSGPLWGTPPPTTAPPTTSAPAPTTSPTTPPQPTPGPPPTTPPPPRISNFSADSTGPGSVRVSFSNYWPNGNEPVTCHYLRDGVEIHTVQCGVSPSITFTNQPSGQHRYAAYVTDIRGASSNTLSADAAVEEPPPSAPQISNFSAYSNGPGSVRVTFSNYWPNGNEPVICHYLRDGVEIHAVQCGVSPSITFTNQPSGQHRYAAYVTDIRGARSNTLSTDVSVQ